MKKLILIVLSFAILSILGYMGIKMLPFTNDAKKDAIKAESFKLDNKI